MKLAAPFIRLPHRFDAAVIGAEIEALDAAAWQDHPRRLDGHLVAALISADGQPDLTRLEGAMQPAETLSRLPALSRVLAALDTIIGRAMQIGRASCRERVEVARGEVGGQEEEGRWCETERR